MKNPNVIKWIQKKFQALAADLDERGRRRWGAVEAQSLGWGGITAVSTATGMSDRTIRTGIHEIELEENTESGRQRRPGGGRKRREQEQPGLINALDDLIEPSSRGDPCCPLRWTCKSTRTLSMTLNKQGYVVGANKVGRLLKASGYSLQSNRKTREGTDHPDRNEQFEFISKRVKAQQKKKNPALSVDTKKKEVLGNKKNNGKTYRPKRNPVEVDMHDFPDKNLGKAIPYGVYDITLNQAAVSIGITHDTAEFAVAAIERWWKRLGKKKYQNSRKILIMADSGGSNSCRSRLWKLGLQRFADSIGKIIEVCHYPPGTSKWNKIEHRVFCHITRNWKGIPLETLEIVVNLIGATTTETGLEVHAWIDEAEYPIGKKVSNAELKECIIKKNKFHGDWNYEIHPKKSG